MSAGQPPTRRNITGNDIMDQLQELQEKAATLDSRFAASLYKFDGEEKDRPQELSEGYLALESRIAVLEELQKRYNLATMVEVPEQEPITLERAIKLYGVYGRLKNQWKKAISAPAHSPYEDTRTRKANMEVAQPQFERAAAEKIYESYVRRQADLKRAIRRGNARGMEFVDSDGLF